MSYADPSRVPGGNPGDAAQESTGPIAKDSLAADSIRDGGEFGENTNANIMGVKGNQSTLNTTDVSGASALPAASSGAAREDRNDMGLGSDEKGAGGQKYPEGLGGQGEFSGRHNLDGYTGGPSSDRASGGYATGQAAGASDFGASTTGSSNTGSADINSSGFSGSAENSGTTSSSGPAAGTGVRPQVDPAPNYAADIQSSGQNKPKGENLIEGDIPETKTFTGDVGGSHDPGRLAEQQFERANADTSGGAPYSGGDNKQPGEGSSGQYDVLDSERA